jgi:hypothetical protein
MTKSKNTRRPLGSEAEMHRLGRSGLCSDLADGTLPVSVSVPLEDGFHLADIEARLTGEVVWLVDALRQFSSRTQLIREEIPLGANPAKAVASTLSLVALQLGNALSLGLDKLTLSDGGDQYLREIGLRLDDVFHEFTLNGRKFYIIADINELSDYGKATDSPVN